MNISGHLLYIRARVLLGAIWTLCAAQALAQQAQIFDLTHFSQTFGEVRNYRIFLPPRYSMDITKRYPVVYFFHGFGERHNVSTDEVGDYDTGYGGDNLSAYVGSHDVIVVKWDGFDPRFAGDTRERPYNVCPVAWPFASDCLSVETQRQFPLYFEELVQYIDATYRTIADRDHRATSGVSMGGFMSYWISGKYPHLVGSASSFMGAPSFNAGPRGNPAEYSHDFLYRNYEGVRTRLVTGSLDFIRWYHRRLQAIWAFTRPFHETEDFVWPHGTPGMSRTLDFHMNAFASPLAKPSMWHHADLYPAFDVWGYIVSTNRQQAGFTVLDNVTRAGFRSAVREWLPDGRLLASVTVNVTTDAIYVPARTYTIADVSLETGKAVRSTKTADAAGRLSFTLTGGRHDIGIMETPAPILTVAGWRLTGSDWPAPSRLVRLKLLLLNKGLSAAPGVIATVTSPNPQVSLQQSAVLLPALLPGRITEASGEIQFTIQDATREILQLRVRLTDVTGTAVDVPLEIPIWRDGPNVPNAIIGDGSTVNLWVEGVNQRPEGIGAGNGNGVANPGETFGVLVPDGPAFRAVELFTLDPCVDLTQRRSDQWGAADFVGAAMKISLPRLTAACRAGQDVRFFLRYAIFNAPDHLLREGVVSFRVQ